MKTGPWLTLLVAFAYSAFPSTGTSQVVLETRALRVEIGEDGAVRSLKAKSSGTEYALASGPVPIALVYRGGKAYPASQATLSGDQLIARFETAGVAATYRVTRNDDYLAFELSELQGQPIDRIDLIRLNLKRLPYLGNWINVVYDDQFGVCLCAGNIKTDAGMTTRGDHVVMRTTAEKDIALEGTTAVLFACRNPKSRFLDVMEIVERDFHMPSGAAHRKSPIQQYSYLWASPTPDDVDEYVKWARRGGFRMILFSYTSFSRSAGHFTWNSRYPNGMADLKKVTDTIRAAGLKLGLHVHYNKAHKHDPYVTPVPDDRLHKVRTFTLAAAVGNGTETIPVNENPTGSTLDEKRRILKAGEELIAYEAFTTEPPYKFTGCQRGALGTAPGAHASGDRASLLDVDTWPIFIRFDQNSDIQDESAARIAEIFRETGPYDMVYFDGAEDVHAPFWHHCANAQQRVFGRFQPQPPVCEAAASSHFSWHMISRSNAYDSVAPDQMKEFCRKAPCRGAASRALDFSRVNFGWLHGFGRSKQSYIAPDVLEYVLSRGAAWDCPFSMTVNPQQLATNPRTEDCFDVIKLWEDARIEGKLSDDQRESLKNLDQEHHLLVDEQGRHELAPVDEIPDVCGGLFKAYGFRRPARPDDAYVLIWHTRGEADLAVPVAADKVVVMRPFGKTLSLKSENGNSVFPVGGRTYIVFPGMQPNRAREVILEAAAR